MSSAVETASDQYRGDASGRLDLHPGQCSRMIGSTLDLIANKWTVPLVIHLSDAEAPMRFGDLTRAIPEITQKELTKKLRELEAAGLVERTVYPVVPPKVEYRLTQLGCSLQPLLSALRDWASEHGETVDENRRRFVSAHE